MVPIQPWSAVQRANFSIFTSKQEGKSATVTGIEPHLLSTQEGKDATVALHSLHHVLLVKHDTLTANQ